ncbi:MAG: efflux RND transporter periplasmic adaptor subunit [Myxococcales bacterium]|nr:efflux RND transporter periplasmic adaptor subunit [Myxococcales bacterium]
MSASPWPRRVAQGVLALAVVAAGLALATYLVRTKPSMKRRPQARQARLVEVTPVARVSEQVVVPAAGTVKPAREIDLYARVSGEVVEVAPALVPGAVLAEGDLIVRVDDADYRLAERQAQSALARSRADLQLERGNQRVAKAERELVGGDVAGDEALMLRKPQLAASLAAVEAAKAAAQRAALDVERARVTAPFNAVVRARQVDLGSRVAPTTPIARLAGVDTWWIEAAVPVDHVRWIHVPTGPDDPGSTVRVFHEAAWGPGVSREGRVISLAADLEERGRLARLLVGVDDPLARRTPDAPALYLGAWVRLEIDGQRLEDVVSLDRALLRDGDRAWVMGADDKLEIRALDIAWRARERVLVASGLVAGDRVVRTDLATPVAGMALRQLGAKSRESKESAAPAGAP